MEEPWNKAVIKVSRGSFHEGCSSSAVCVVGRLDGIDCRCVGTSCTSLLSIEGGMVWVANHVGNGDRMLSPLSGVSEKVAQASYSSRSTRR